MLREEEEEEEERFARGVARGAPPWRTDEHTEGLHAEERAKEKMGRDGVGNAEGAAVDKVIWRCGLWIQLHLSHYGISTKLVCGED